MSNTDLWLQIPTEIVRNIGFTIDEKSFSIYAYFLFRKFKNYNDCDLTMDLSNIKAATTITDNRTIKKCLLQLFEQGLIADEIVKLPINKPLHIKMLEPYKNDYFTQLPLKLMMNLKVVGFIGFRLMYYYESFINRKILTKLFSYPSYETIKSNLILSNNSVSKYNTILTEIKYISITKHKVENDPFGDSGFDKFNNHYHVNILNI